MKDVETVSFFRKKIYHLVIHSHICLAMSGHEQNWNIVVGFERKRQCTPSRPHTGSDHQLMMWMSWVDMWLFTNHNHGAGLHTEATPLFLSFSPIALDLREKTELGVLVSAPMESTDTWNFPLLLLWFTIHFCSIPISKQQNWRTFLQEWFSLEFIQV